MKWGIDSSFGRSLRAWMPDMVAHGLAFCIWRIGEGLRSEDLDDVSDQVAACEENGVPYAFYYAIHPWSNPIAQVDRFLAHAAPYHPSSLWEDDELTSTNMTSAQLDAVYHQAADDLRNKIQLPVGIYSGKWFIDNHCPRMKFWLPEFPYWNAAYYYHPFHPANWDEFAAAVEAPAWPVITGYPPVSVWQFAGDTVLPMAGDDADYNRIDDEAVYQQLFGQAPPAPSDHVHVDVEHLNLRSQPAIQDNVLAVLDYRTELQVLERRMVGGREWLRVQLEGWCAGWLTKE